MEDARMSDLARSPAQFLGNLKISCNIIDNSLDLCKCQNIYPIFAVIFVGCIITWGENSFESQILRGKNSKNIFKQKKPTLASNTSCKNNS